MANIFITNALLKSKLWKADRHHLTRWDVHVFIELATYLPDFTGRVFDGLSLREDENGVLIVLRGHRGKRKEVSFLRGERMELAMLRLTRGIVFGVLEWSDDRYS